MLSVRMLGELEADWDGCPVDLPRSARVRSLFAWLVLDPRQHTRSRVAARFWPDVLDASARASLRSAVWTLRMALGGCAEAVLAADRASVGVRAGAIAADVEVFTRLLACGELEEAVALCRGEFLAELDDDWVFEARDAHVRLLDGALEQLAARAEAVGDPRGAVDWSRQRAIRSPLDQAAARALIRRLAAVGDLPGALEVYRRLDARLRFALGLGPDAETRALVRGLRGAPGDAEGDPIPSEGPRAAAPRVGSSLVRGKLEVPRLDPARILAAGGDAADGTIARDGATGATRLLEDVGSMARRRGFVTAAVSGS